MINSNGISNGIDIDDEVIRKLGLRLSDIPVNVQLDRHAREFKYPYLDNVFVMESDLYGNMMPEGSCFLAFYGSRGLQGEYLNVEFLKKASVKDIKKIVESNLEG